MAALLIGAALLPSVHPTLALGVVAVVLIASGVADAVTRAPQTDATHR